MTTNLINRDETSVARPTTEPRGGSEASSPVGRPLEAGYAMEAKDLTVGFGTKTILHDISVPFPRGTITALIGPTGSGKSVFVRTLNRMNDRIPIFHRSGDVELEGRSIWARDQDLQTLSRRVGMAFQRPNPFPISIRDNVVAGVKAHRMARSRDLTNVAEHWLREVGLWEAVKDRLGGSPYALSGGQQQLLCLARALAIDPQVLLLDEPTSSLDPKATAAIETLVQHLTPAITVIIVTHNLAQARRVSNRTMLFFDGHLVEYGETDLMFTAPGEERTRQYVGGRLG
jgi:phosphate transport system ATP-binding protein